MKRYFYLTALLFCSACGIDDATIRQISGTTGKTAGSSVTTSVTQTAPLARDDFDGTAVKIVEAINKAFEETRTPTGAIFGHWMTESGEIYGDTGHAGGCSAREQYEIMAVWRPSRGKANLAALAYIAKNLHRDIDTIQGSCGNSTLEKRGTTFGGALGPAQVLADGWVSDPLSKDKDVLNLLDGIAWIARHDRIQFDNAPAGYNEDDLARWEYAVRSYYGALGSDANEKSQKRQEPSLLYYKHVTAHWIRWGKASQEERVALVKANLIRRNRQNS